MKRIALTLVLLGFSTLATAAVEARSNREAIVETRSDSEARETREAAVEVLEARVEALEARVETLEAARVAARVEALVEKAIETFDKARESLKEAL